MYLLDTCAISELVAKKPNEKVLKWLSAQDENNLYLSILTIAEIKKGIYLLPPSRKRIALEVWCQKEVLDRFAGRILMFDERAADTWAKMIAICKTQGLTRSAIDSLIEAVALEHNLWLVTRNEKNFLHSQVSILNIWD